MDTEVVDTAEAMEGTVAVTDTAEVMEDTVEAMDIAAMGITGGHGGGGLLPGHIGLGVTHIMAIPTMQVITPIMIIPTTQVTPMMIVHTTEFHRMEPKRLHSQSRL